MSKRICRYWYVMALAFVAYGMWEKWGERAEVPADGTWEIGPTETLRVQDDPSMHYDPAGWHKRYSDDGTMWIYASRTAECKTVDYDGGKYFTCAER